MLPNLSSLSLIQPRSVSADGEIVEDADAEMEEAGALPEPPVEAGSYWATAADSFWASRPPPTEDSKKWEWRSYFRYTGWRSW